MPETIVSPPVVKNNYRSPALEKGLSVLELLADSPHPLSLTEISKLLQRTKQELFRVVACLHERGYLMRDQSQRYRVSTKLFELGAKNRSTQTLVARAMPHMQHLVDTLGESCHLNVVVQDRMLVVARAECAADVSLSVRVGATFDLHQRISGRVALAVMSPDERKKYWSRTKESATHIRRWEKEFTEIQKAGFELADSPIVPSVMDCAVPVFGAEKALLCVLCVSYLVRVDKKSVDKNIPHSLQACATAVTAEFVAKPAEPAAE